LPELIQTQLLPQFAGQPAVAEYARSPQFQTAQAHLDAVNGIGWNLPVIGKQTHGGEALLGFIEHFQRPAPCCLLPVVDLTQIQNRALRRLAAGQTAVLDNAEVAMVLAVFASVGAAQKHLSAAAWQRSQAQKRGKVFTWPVPAESPLKAKRILPHDRRKCPLSAKVRLSH